MAEEIKKRGRPRLDGEKEEVDEKEESTQVKESMGTTKKPKFDLKKQNPVGV
jgi:hypothetical protein